MVERELNPVDYYETFARDVNSLHWPNGTFGQRKTNKFWDLKNFIQFYKNIACIHRKLS